MFFRIPNGIITVTQPEHPVKAESLLRESQMSLSTTHHSDIIIGANRKINISQNLGSVK
jgi:hypothetical protein